MRSAKSQLRIGVQQAESRRPCVGSCVHTGTSAVKPAMIRKGSWLPILFLLLTCLVLESCSFSNGAYPIRLALMPSEVSDAAAGETCVLLVRLSASTDKQVDLNRSFPLHIDCTGGVVQDAPDALFLGEAGEIHIVPDLSKVGTSIEVRVTSLQGILPMISHLHVTEPPIYRNELIRDAAQVRERFISWLADANPDLTIATDTVWTAIPIRTHRLVVTHCLFLSADWEMVVWWHVTIAPNDWARIYLRRRHVEFSPSMAAEILSRELGDGPHAIDPPIAILR